MVVNFYLQAPIFSKLRRGASNRALSRELSPSLAEKVGGWCCFSISHAEGLVEKPSRAFILAIPSPKRLRGRRRFSLSRVPRGW